MRQANWHKIGGESPLKRRTNHPRFSASRAWAPVRVSASVGSGAYGQAIEHRKLPDRKCRGCSRGRRQHRLDRQGEGQPGSAVSKNPCTYVHLVSGPGRAYSLPGESRGLVGKGKAVTHEGREEAIGFTHSSDEAGEQGGGTLCGVGGARGGTKGNSAHQSTATQSRATVTQAGVGYGGRRDLPSLPEVGAVCLNGHARICAGGAGQPASLPRLQSPNSGGA